jgi:hypothetical protein
MKIQFWELPADGALIAASSSLVIVSSGTASGFNCRNARALYIASNSPMSVILADPWLG